ncbi:hypothetical protein RRG08_021724 [Elysia crispata]|uniref:Galectin n=1 Tax=Elysia crispata TaxID=231223 RepID=A0AAE0ZXN7_9GAST|nr:hypothetical protein RRG08_021724 [Elysia crispata]
MASVALLMFACYGILWLGLTLCTSVSTNFKKLKDLEFDCDVSPDSLVPGFSDYITCARACKERIDCTFFVFTPNISRAPSGAKVGRCTACPASNITGLNYIPINPQAETWLHTLGHVLDPQPYKYISIPGALSIGRLLVVKGRAPKPAPNRMVIDVFHNNKADVTTRITPRFNYHGMVDRMVVSSRVSGKWAVTVFPESIFPFAEGKDFEINLLATRQGFMVYVNESFMRTVVKTIYMANDIGYLRFETTDVYMISY